MTNILRDSAAPYVLAILIGACGWIVNESVAELKKLNIIEYTISYDASPPRAVVEMYNRSLTSSLGSGQFELFCSAADLACFAGTDSLPSATVAPIGGVWVDSQAKWEVPHKIVSAAAVLPQGAGVKYLVPLAAKDEKIWLTYHGGAGTAVVLRNGWSLEGFLTGNYLAILVCVLVGLLLIFAVYIAAAALAPPPTADPATAQGRGKQPGS
jgi:hypothetical protein